MLTATYIYSRCSVWCWLHATTYVDGVVCVMQGGIESEEDYPYCSGLGKCFPCAAPGYNKTRCGPPVPATGCLKNESCAAKMNSSNFVPNLTLKSWVAIEKVRVWKSSRIMTAIIGLQNESVIQQDLVQRGPLSIAINAMTLQFYHSGVWDPILKCDPKSLDHGRQMKLLWKVIICSECSCAVGGLWCTPRPIWNQAILAHQKQLGREVGRKGLFPHDQRQRKMWTKSASHISSIRLNANLNDNDGDKIILWLMI